MTLCYETGILGRRAGMLTGVRHPCLVTTKEKYVIALVLAASAKTEAARESYVDISVEMALSHDWSAEDRIAMRDAAAMVLRTMGVEVDLLEAVRQAITETLCFS